MTLIIALCSLTTTVSVEITIIFRVLYYILFTIAIFLLTNQINRLKIVILTKFFFHFFFLFGFLFFLCLEKNERSILIFWNFRLENLAVLNLSNGPEKKSDCVPKARDQSLFCGIKDGDRTEFDWGGPAGTGVDLWTPFTYERSPARRLALD